MAHTTVQSEVEGALSMFHASEIATATTCAVFASVGLLATNEAAGATWVRENASGCQPVSDYDRQHVNYGAGFADSSEDYIDLICPFREREGLQRDDLTEFYVYGYDNVAYADIFASICVVSYDGGSGSCSADQRSWNTPGSVVLSWNLAYTPWETTTSGTSYIRVRIDDGVGFYGYYAKVE